MTLPLLGSKLVAAVGHIPEVQDQDAVLLGKLVPRKLKELNLTYACQDKTNVFAKQAQQGSMSWIKEYGQLGPVQLSEKHFSVIEDYRIGNLLGRAHPDATEELLSITSDFATWLFAYDDIVEKIKNKQQAEIWHEQTLRIIDGADAPKGADGLMRGLEQIMGRLKPHCSPSWKARFSKGVKEYTEATLWEIENRNSKRNPSVKEYKELRPKTSGTEVMFRFIEIVEGIELSDEVVEREDFRVVFDAGVEIVNFGNDIISSPKETKDGMHNLLFAYKNELSCSYEEALHHASRDLSDNIRKFDEMKEKYSGPLPKEVEKFFSGIRAWDDANLLWSIKWSENDSDRYTRHCSESFF